MQTAVFHSVNSALYLYNRGTGILVDAIHSGTRSGFSLMPPSLYTQLEHHTGLFAHADGLLFTHTHSDHYDADGLRTALDVPKPPLVYSPGLSKSTAPVRVIQPGVKSIHIAQTEITAIKTNHMASHSPQGPHECFIIRMGSENLFVAADADLNGSLAASIMAHDPVIDLAFFNLYHLALPDGQDFLRVMHPTRVFLYHLPFAGDDIYNYRIMARQMKEKYPKDLPPFEILRQMSWLDDAIPSWSKP
jgi:L-ascorbate metabolism protein UlaG (beta-lactamase superfamily)